MLPYDATVIGTSGALDESSDVLAESVGSVAALASPASGAASLGPSLALESSVPFGKISTAPECGPAPYGG